MNEPSATDTTDMDVTMPTAGQDVADVGTQDDSGIGGHRKKSSRFAAALRFGFGGKKNKVSEADEESTLFQPPLKKTKKKSKKEKDAAPKRGRPEKVLSASTLQRGVSRYDIDDESIARRPRGHSLPEGGFPDLERAHKSTSKMSIASSLVRKISFGKFREKKKAKVPAAPVAASASPDRSPFMSDEDLNSTASSSFDSRRRDAPSVSSHENLTVTSTPSHHTLSPSPMETDEDVEDYAEPRELIRAESVATRQLIAAETRQTRETMGDTADDEPKSVKVSEVESVPRKTKDFLRGETEEDATETSPTPSDSFDNKLRRLPYADQDTPPTPSCTPYRRQTRSPSPSEPPINDANLEKLATSGTRVAKPVGFAVNVALEDPPVSEVECLVQVGVVEKPLAVPDRPGEQRESVETIADRAAVDNSRLQSATSRAAETLRVRSAWIMKQDDTASVSADPTDPTEPQPQPQPQRDKAKKSTKKLILEITTPLCELQEADFIASRADNPNDDDADADELVVPTPDEAVTTPNNVSAGPKAGSSKSETFFTPRETPLGTPPKMTSFEVESFSSTSTGAAAAAFYTPVSKDATVASTAENIMAEARERLSISLGISTSPTSLTSPTQLGDKREHLYKILVIGELGTGKTSIIKRYVHQFFSQHYRATIGVDFALKVLNWDANTIIRLQLWDIAGQERFGNMTRVYYKEAVGAFIVFDVTRAATFDAVVKWKQDLDSKVQLADGSSIPCVLLANKCDQQKEGLVNNPGKMDEYCKERGFSGWYETSAKENINIEEAARALVTKILQNDQLRTQSDSLKDGEKINLDGHNSPDDTKSKCSC